jgi:hypothetical protein
MSENYATDIDDNRTGHHSTLTADVNTEQGEKSILEKPTSHKFRPLIPQK